MKVNIHRLLKEAKDAVPQAEWIGLRRVTNYLTGFSAIDGKFDEAAGGSDEGVMLKTCAKRNAASTVIPLFPFMIRPICVCESPVICASLYAVI